MAQNYYSPQNFNRDSGKTMEYFARKGALIFSDIIRFTVNAITSMINMFLGKY